MVILSEFRMEQYRDDDHREDAPDLTNPRTTCHSKKYSGERIQSHFFDQFFGQTGI